MIPLAAGKLRQKITLQRPSTSVDNALSEPVDSWVDVATTRAEIKALSGREIADVRQRYAEATHSIMFRWLGESVAVDPTWRALFGSRALNLVDVENVEEMNAYYICIAAEEK